MTRKIIVITGPTASGKTKLTVNLAKVINAQVICADSRIVYKDLDIVSAKPSISERENILHHLIDIKTPYETFSAGDFTKLAQDIIDKTSDNIIISGGTWFYIKSLLDNEALPECEIDFEKRRELENFESSVLWEKLNKLDPKRAQVIHPNNKDKIIRSIEMCEALGGAISTYKRKENKKYDVIWFSSDIERAELYERINLRVDEMIKLGLYQEWQKNKEKYPNSLVIQNTIGYSEFFEYEDINFAIDKIKQHTRNFAKRQLSWFNQQKYINKVKNSVDICAKIGL